MANMIRIATLTAFASTFVSALAFGQTLSPQAQAPSPSTQSTPPATLIVTVQGVRSNKGKVRAGLLKADPVAGIAQSVGGNVVVATPGTITLRFEKLTPGDYAVQLFHDENDNGEMDSNLFGIPSEGYGFSNNARASFGPPKFAQMKVSVGADAVQTTATLSY